MVRVMTKPWRCARRGNEAGEQRVYRWIKGDEESAKSNLQWFRRGLCRNIILLDCYARNRGNETTKRCRE